MKTIKYSILTIAFLMYALTASAHQTADYYPLSPGTYWVYKGTVKWTESADKVKSRNVTWRMQVTNRFKNGPFDLAVIKGHPSDLSWYEPGKKPGDHVIVWKDGIYYLIAINNDLNMLITDQSYLSKKLSYHKVFLTSPLKVGLEFGMAPNDQRTDQMYRWIVSDEKKAKLTNIIGLQKQQEVIQFTLTYRSNPDHAIVTYAPSIGILNYVYSHHGAVSEVDIRLIKFHRN